MIINKNKLKQLFGIMSLLIVESNWTIVFSNTNPPMNSIAPMCATFLYKKKKKKTRYVANVSFSFICRSVVVVLDQRSCIFTWSALSKVSVKFGRHVKKFWRISLKSGKEWQFRPLLYWLVHYVDKSCSIKVLVYQKCLNKALKICGEIGTSKGIKVVLIFKSKLEKEKHFWRESTISWKISTLKMMKEGNTLNKVINKTT